MPVTLTQPQELNLVVDVKIKLKMCHTCKVLKSTKAFHKSKTAPDGFYYSCKKCQNYRQKLRARINKDKAITYLGKKCERCGKEFHPACMDFHHVRGKDKGVASLMSHSWDKIRQELDKCVLLCSNCHRIEHYD